MNVFQLNYVSRIRQWHDLRNSLESADINKKCIEIDNWWQKAPLVNHHLHILDQTGWPGPWDLLEENTYCTLARAIGMCYTLLLTGVTDIELVEATDETGNDVILVLVDRAKYVLNYWPNTVVNNCSTDFTIRRRLDISKLQQKI